MIVRINAYADWKGIWSLSAKTTPVTTFQHFVVTCDHGQTTIDYHHIYFMYIRLYKVQVATNVQLKYNYEIFLCGILIINSSYFQTVVIPYEGNELSPLRFQLKHE
jgi:hypothetical protein